MPSLQATIKLPEYVYLTEGTPLQVALWDTNNHNWTVEGVEDVKLGSDNAILSFKVCKLAPMAFVIDRCIDFPYKSWYIACTAVDEAIFNLATKRDSFVFKITPEGVQLIERNESSLAHIANKEMPPGLLLHELLKSGINLMPTNEDEAAIGFKIKNRDAEERAIFELATSVNGFAFRSSVWNKIGRAHV